MACEAESSEILPMQFELLYAWPPLDDPGTLFVDFDSGTVDYAAVSAYLSSSFPDGTPLNINLEESPGLRLALDVVDENVISDKDADRAVLLRWKDENPINYAVLMYIADQLKKSVEPRIMPVSPELALDPLVELDLDFELRRYFGLALEYRRETVELIVAAQKNLLAPVNDVNELECIIAIPVAGHQEHANIYHTLEQYSRGKMPTDRYEIILNINIPDDDHENVDMLRLTMSQINKFREQNPGVSVRGFINSYNGSDAVIGRIRGDLWDTIAFDMMIRGRKDDILIISGDADVDNANDEFLNEMVHTWRETGADIASASFIWQKIPDLSYRSAANRMLRYNNFMLNAQFNNQSTILVMDGITGLSLAAYLASGGHDRQAAHLEMYSIVQRIRHYRQTPEDRGKAGFQPVKTVEVKVRGARLRSSSRRPAQAMALGYAPFHGWSFNLIAFGNNDPVRSAEMQVDVAEQYASERWRNWLKEMTRHYIPDMPLAKKRRILKAARRVLGFEDLYPKKSEEAA